MSKACSKGQLGQHRVELPVTSHLLFFSIHLEKKMQKINPNSSKEHGAQFSLWPSSCFHSPLLWCLCERGPWASAPPQMTAHEMAPFHSAPCFPLLKVHLGNSTMTRLFKWISSLHYTLQIIPFQQPSLIVHPFLRWIKNKWLWFFILKQTYTLTISL